LLRFAAAPQLQRYAFSSNLAHSRMIMRILILICCLFLTASFAFAQNRTEETDGDTYSVRFIRDAVKNPNFVLGVSFTEKRINRMGDGISIALVKIYDVDELKNPQNIKNYLPLMEAAFVAPRIVTIAEDKNPKVTMFLLRFLQTEVSDAGLKAKIADTIKYIEKQTSKE
jgi:hypothetical protein